MNWQEEILKLVMIKQVLGELDTHRVWPHHLPSVAASTKSIANAESRLGHALDTQYSDFLRHADGWMGFYQTVDLFGTADLMDSPKMRHAYSLFSVMGEALNASGFRSNELLPIGVTTLDRDLFAMPRPSNAHAGSVIWFSGQEVDRFPSFEYFFLAMMDYNREEVAYFKSLK